MVWTRLLSFFLLIGLPTLAFPPLYEDLPPIPRPVHHQALWQASPEHLTYDNILFFLDELESGALEERCSENDLYEINLFLVRLGEQGLLPDTDTEAFYEDSEELLNPDYLAFKYDKDTSYELQSAISFGAFKAEVHKVGLRKFWKKTKKWCKKHKKGIIIGSVVVAVVAIVVTVAVLTSGGAEAASTAAAAAGAAGGEGSSVAPAAAIGGAAIGAIASSDSSKDESEESNTPLAETIEERPDLANILEDHCGEMKDSIAADIEMIQAEGNSGDTSLSEVGRTYGATTAESAFREATASPNTAQENGLNLSQDPALFSRECDQAVDKIHESFGLEKPSQATLAPLAAGAAALRLPGGPVVQATAATAAIAAVAAFPEETQKAYNAISDGAGYVADKALEGVAYAKDRAIEAGENIASWAAGAQPTTALESRSGEFVDDRILQPPEEYFEGFPDRVLPRKPGGEPMPDVAEPHTQLGTRDSHRTGKYKQAREFDESGKDVKRADFTDHNDPVKHPNPHQHRVEPNETGGTKKISPAEPLAAD